MNLSETAGFLVRHPVRSTLRAAGMVMGAAQVLSGRADVEETARPLAAVPAQRVLAREPLPAAEQVAPAEPGESFATEPAPVSHDDAHAGSGPVEDWQEELGDPIGGPTAEPVVTGADAVLPMSAGNADEPLLDPALTKQVRGEMDRGLGDAES